MMSFNNLPDRWLDYTAVGTQIKNTPFVALKCPLGDHLLRHVNLEEQFGLNEMKTLLPEVSLVIDLSNTNRYYDPNELEASGIQHEKIRVPGRVLPSTDLLKQFFQIVDNFLIESNSNKKLIGVHCTHGVNRTGFFICSYMICKMKFTYESAIAEFSKARGHPIERDIYHEQLKIYEIRPIEFLCGSDNSFAPGDNRKKNEKCAIKYAKRRSCEQLLTDVRSNYFSFKNRDYFLDQQKFLFQQKYSLPYRNNRQSGFFNGNHDHYRNNSVTEVFHKNSKKYRNDLRTNFMKNAYGYHSSRIPPTSYLQTKFRHNI